MPFNALSLGTGLSGLVQGFQQAQQQRQQQQMQEMQMAAFRQKQAEQQNAQRAQGDIFQAIMTGGLGNLGNGMNPPAGTPQPPMPGQPSMPMQQPTNLPPPQGGMSIPANGPLSPEQAAYALPIIKRDESGGQNIPQRAYSGQGINPSTGTHTPPSSAQGYEQFTDSTWRDQAPKAGVDTRQFPNAMVAPEATQDKVAMNTLQTVGVSPWAPWNKKLAADLGVSPSSPPAQKASQTAASVMQQTPVGAYGRLNLQQLAQSIEKTDPDAPAAVKYMALAEAQKLLAPDDKVQLQMMMLQNREQFQLALKDMTIENQRTMAADRASQAQNKGFQFLTKPDGTIVRANPNTGDVAPVDLPAGAGKMGAGSKPSQFTQQDVDYWSSVLKNGGHFPPGLARTSAGSQFVQQVMAKMGSSGEPNDFIANVATVKADEGSLRNMTKMADAATSFEKTASQNFDLALNLSKDAIPTDWGPWLNRWIESGQTQFGDTNVPPYVTAMLTGANEYAKIMSGSTGAQGSTVDSRREAAELFSPYLSKGQIDRVVAVAKQDMQNRKGSLYGQIDDIKGRLKGAGKGGSSPSEGTAAPSGSAPAPGTVQGGYRFKGGDPAEQSNWERVQ